MRCVTRAKPDFALGLFNISKNSVSSVCSVSSVRITLQRYSLPLGYFLYSILTP